MRLYHPHTRALLRPVAAALALSLGPAPWTLAQQPVPSPTPPPEPVVSPEVPATDTHPPDSTPAPVPSPSPAPVAPPEHLRNVVKMLGGPGMPDMKGKENWDNSITITGDSITFESATHQFPVTTARLDHLTTIVYGQASSRHVGTWVAVGVLLAPIALFGLFHKSRKHNVLISWTDDTHQERGAYFEINKEHFRRFLNTVSFRAQKPIFADEKDRKWLMTQGVAAKADPTETEERAKEK